MGYVCVDGVFTPAHAFINKTKHGEKDKKIFDYAVCDFDGMRRERVRVMMDSAEENSNASMVESVGGSETESEKTTSESKEDETESVVGGSVEESEDGQESFEELPTSQESEVTSEEDSEPEESLEEESSTPKDEDSQDDEIDSTSDDGYVDIEFPRPQ